MTAIAAHGIIAMRHSLASPLLRSLAVFSISAAIGMAAPSATHATVIPVTTTQDVIGGDAQCSLREAIMQARYDDAFGGSGECPEGTASDEIIVPAGDYVLTRASAGEVDNETVDDLDIIDTDVIIRGAGAGDTIIRIGGAIDDRVLDIRNSSVVITGVQISGGRARPGMGSVAGEEGGGVRIVTPAFVEIRRSAIVENLAGGDAPLANGGPGGGLALLQGEPGVSALLIEDTLIADNSSGNVGASPAGPAINASGGGLYLAGGTGSIVTLRRVKVRTNHATHADTENASFGNVAGGGIAIVAGGDVTIEESDITGNVADSNFGFGGGIVVGPASAGGSLTIRRSALVGNRALNGGGIAATAGLSLRNVTLSNNAALLSGGALYLAGDVADIAFTTIYTNTAGRGGGGLTMLGAAPLVRNSIVAGNQGGLGPRDCAQTPELMFSGGYNLFSLDGGCANLAATDRVTSDPALSPLIWSNTPLPYHLPLDASLAIDAANCALSGVTDDQLRFERPVDLPFASNNADGCDAGAIENQGERIFRNGFE
jgi:CSLREA domain-containing protein